MTTTGTGSSSGSNIKIKRVAERPASPNSSELATSNDAPAVGTGAEVSSMDVAFTQYIGQGHGSGGNFSRWLDELQFLFQQCICTLGGESFDVLSIDLMMPGPKRGFGPPRIELNKNEKARKIKGVLVLDPEMYGACQKSDERIRGIVVGLAELTGKLCETLGKSEIASNYSARVARLSESVLEN